MERIASFCVDHNTLVPGMYLSRKDGDVLTWDIRMKTPNKGSYLSPACAHTIEHLFATYARNSAFQDSVIYVGPMGCRTGFYLLTDSTVERFNGVGEFQWSQPLSARPRALIAGRQIMVFTGNTVQVVTPPEQTASSGQ